MHQGNYDDGSSKGMEGYALDIAIQRLQSSGLGCSDHRLGRRPGLLCAQTAT